MNKKDIRGYLMRNATGPVSDRIMNYVTEHVFSVAYMNMDKLAYATESTTDEVNEFFRTLGFETFFDFKAALRESSYFEKEGGDFQRTDIKSIAEQMMRCEMQNLTEFFGELDYDMLDRLAQDVLAASEVVFIGMRVGVPYAFYAVNMLNRIGIRATRFDVRDSNYIDYIKTLDRSALVISFGFPRYHKATVISTSVMKKRGFHIVSITDSARSPVALLSDYSFVVPVHSYDFADSFTAGMLLIDLLTFRLALLDHEGTRQSINDYVQISNDVDLFI